MLLTCFNAISSPLGKFLFVPILSISLLSLFTSCLTKSSSITTLSPIDLTASDPVPVPVPVPVPAPILSPVPYQFLLPPHSTVSDSGPSKLSSVPLSHPPSELSKQAERQIPIQSQQERDLVQIRNKVQDEHFCSNMGNRQDLGPMSHGNKSDSQMKKKCITSISVQQIKISES